MSDFGLYTQVSDSGPHGPLVLKFCIHIVIRDELYKIVNRQNPSIFNRVTALVHTGKIVSGILFLYYL